MSYRETFHHQMLLQGMTRKISLSKESMMILCLMFPVWKKFMCPENGLATFSVSTNGKNLQKNMGSKDHTSWCGYQTIPSTNNSRQSLCIVWRMRSNILQNCLVRKRQKKSGMWNCKKEGVLRQYKQNPLFALTEEGKRKAREIVGYLLFPRSCMRCIW